MNIATNPTDANTITVKPFIWHEHIEDTLAMLKEPWFALSFALDHVPDFMARDFLEDWRNGVGLRGWLEGLREDLMTGQEASA